MRYWPQVQEQVKRWKFAPFLVNGAATTAQVEEFVEIVPAEHLPVQHVQKPPLHADSKIVITLERSACLGDCPAYSVSLSAKEINFDGQSHVVAAGHHRAAITPDRVRNLAQKFLDADFYSMEDSYWFGISDYPSYSLSISIDGRKKQVLDYTGSAVGMPSVITDLQESVDQVAGTDRWIEGANGLVSALTAEGFNFKSYNAQVLLKRAALKQQDTTVHQLIESGVPLKKKIQPPPGIPPTPFNDLGFLTAASDCPPILRELIAAGIGKADQQEKNMAITNAARSGSLESVKLLIGCGADPNAGDAQIASGSVLIDAVYSGNPDLVKEILKYHPNLEARNYRHQTAVFSVSGRNPNGQGPCLRLLAQAGANVNARDSAGNTPLHEIYYADVAEQLLKFGADVNARNNNGETPIFTNLADDCVPLLISHGADLKIRNANGQTVFDAAKAAGPRRQEVFAKPPPSFVSPFNSITSRRSSQKRPNRFYQSQ